MTQNEAQKIEYLSGLKLCSNVSGLEDFIERINRDPNPALIHDFTTNVSLRRSENNPNIPKEMKPFLFSNKQPTAVLDEAMGYMQDNSEEIQKFLGKYGTNVIDDYIGILEDQIKNGEGLKDITTKLNEVKEDSDKKRILNDIETSLYEAIGRMVSNYNVNEKADERIKEVAGKLKQMESLKQDEKKEVVDEEWKKGLRLRTGTVDIDIPYNKSYELMKSVLYRELGKNFVKIDEKGEFKLNKEMFKAVYENENNLKKVASGIYSILNKSKQE